MSNRLLKRPCLLLHCDGADGSTAFLDATGRHLVTPNGNAQIDTAQSKFGGASGYFDGTGDYLSLDGSDDFNFGTGDFTIDYWVRHDTGLSGRYDYHYSNGADISTDFGMAAGPTGIMYFSASSENYIYSDTGVIVEETWQHIAVARARGITKLFVGGIQRGISYTDTHSWGTDSNCPQIGQGWGGTPHKGHIDCLRIIKGYAAWTENFTPPTVPYSLARPIDLIHGVPTFRRSLVLGADVLDNGLKELDSADEIHLLSQEPENYADVASYSLGKKEHTEPVPVLLLHMNGVDGSTSFIDNTGRHLVTAHGDAQLDTAQNKFGNASAYFDGDTTSNITIPPHADFTFGTGDFTIDFWMRWQANSPDYQNIFDLGNGLVIWTQGGQDINVSNGNGWVLAVQPSLNNDFWVGSWHHVAITRASGNLRIFVEGDYGVWYEGLPWQYSQVYADASYYQSTHAAALGGQDWDSQAHANWIDEVRIIKGSAVWTAPFTPPSAPYTLLFSDLQAALPTGRKVVSAAVVNGVAATSGLASQWAAVDSAGSRLLAKGALKTPFNVYEGSNFALDAISIHAGGDAFWLPYADGSYAALFADVCNDQYWFDGIEYNSFSAWLTAVGGTFGRNHTSYYCGNDGLLHQAATNAPRIEYDLLTKACRGLLLEGERTNRCKYQDLTNNSYWTKDRIEIDTGRTAPDGTSTAYKMRCIANNVDWKVVASDWIIDFGNFNTRSFSCFVKQDGIYPKLQFQISDAWATGPVVRFNLTTGTATLVNTPTWTGIGYDIIKLPDGWWFCYIIGTPLSDEGGQQISVRFSIYNADDQGQFWADGTSGIVIWGIQAEEGPSPSSYIPTINASVTRPQDLLQFPNGSNAANLFDQSAHTEFMQVYRMRQSSGARLLGNPAAGYHRFKQDGANVEAYTGSALDAALGAYSGPWLSHDVMVARAQNASGQSLCANGGAVASNANTIPTGYGLEVFGGSGTTEAHGYLRSIGLFNAKLSDSALRDFCVPRLVEPPILLPKWHLEDAAIDLGFAEGKYFDGIAMGADVNDFLSCARTQTVTSYAKTAAGALVPFDSNELRITDLGLLVEGGRTNLCLYSQDFDNASGWSLQGGASITGNVGAAPNGTTTADLLATTGGSQFIRTSIYTTTNVDATFSIYAKAGASNWICFHTSVSPNYILVWFDLANGVVGSNQVGTTSVLTSASIEAMGGGWYRCTFVGRYTNDNFHYVGCYPTSSDLGGSANGNSVYVWGCQVEKDVNFPSSYIPTTTASVARPADVVTAINNLDTILTNLPASAVVDVTDWSGVNGWYKRYVADAANQIINPITSNGNNTQVTFDTCTGTPRFLVATLGNSRTWSGGVKAGAAWGSGGRSVVGGGGTVASDTVVASNGNVQTMSLGQGMYAEDFMYGLFRRLTVWNSRLLDAKLQGHTSP